MAEVGMWIAFAQAAVTGKPRSSDRHHPATNSKRDNAVRIKSQDRLALGPGRAPDTARHGSLRAFGERTVNRLRVRFILGLWWLELRYYWLGLAGTARAEHRRRLCGRVRIHPEQRRLGLPADSHLRDYELFAARRHDWFNREHRFHRPGWRRSRCGLVCRKRRPRWSRWWRRYQ